VCVTTLSPADSLLHQNGRRPELAPVISDDDSNAENHIKCTAPFWLCSRLRAALCTQGRHNLIGQALDDALRIWRHQIQNKVRGGHGHERA
jgi:hypothetical protein